MNALPIFNLLLPFARTAVNSMADGEPKTVLTLILKCADAVKPDVPADTPDTAAKAAAFAQKALPHLQAVLPSAGIVGSIVAVTIDLAEYLADEVAAPVTGDVSGKFGDDGLPLPEGN